MRTDREIVARWDPQSLTLWVKAGDEPWISYGRGLSAGLMQLMDTISTSETVARDMAEMIVWRQRRTA